MRTAGIPTCGQDQPQANCYGQLPRQLYFPDMHVTLPPFPFRTYLVQRTDTPSPLVPVPFPSCLFLKVTLPLFCSSFSLSEWGRTSLIDCRHVHCLFTWFVQTASSPLNSSLILSTCPLWLILFYDFPPCSMLMMCPVVLIPTCRCITSLHLFYAIQGILLHPSLTLSPLNNPLVNSIL